MQVASPQGHPLVADPKETRQEAVRLNDSRLSIIEQNTRPETAQTAQAVKPTDDIVDVREEAQNIAKLEEAIANVNRASTGGALQTALGALQGFLENNSFSEIVEEALGGLAKLADDLLSTIGSNPDVLDSAVALKLNADFNFQEIASDGFYSRDVSLNVTFSYADGDTAINGELNFAESILDNGTETFYSRQEEAALSLVTINADLEKNKALSSFINLAEAVTGINIQAMLEETQSAATKLPDLQGRGIDVANLLSSANDTVYYQQRIEVRLVEVLLEDARELKASIEALRERALDQANPAITNAVPTAVEAATPQLLSA